MLKGQPPVKKRTNNFDSCRDLSGRRLRHVNQEKMLSDWQQRKTEEEKMLKDYTNPNNKKNGNNYVEKIHQKEIEAMNTEFKFDNYEVTESISSSIKYLMRKKTRENSERVKIEKLELKDFNEKKIREHNNFNYEKFKQDDFQAKFNNSYSLFGNIKKIYDEQNKHNMDINSHNMDCNNGIKKNSLKGKINLDFDKINNKGFLVTSSRDKNQKNQKEEIEKTASLCQNIDLSLKEETNEKTLIGKNDINDNLSQISEDSCGKYNKEDLEKELFDF